MKKVLYSPKVAPYLFILPFILTVLIFWISPLVKSGIMSTQNIIPGSVENIGLRNYQRLFKDRLFFLALGNSVKYTIWTLIILIPVPLLLAVLINSKIGSDKFKKLTAEEQKVVLDGARLFANVTFGVQPWKELKAYEDFRKSGGKVYIPTQAEAAKFRELAKPIRDWYLNEYKEEGKEFLAAVEKYIASASKNIADENTTVMNMK